MASRAAGCWNNSAKQRTNCIEMHVCNGNFTSRNATSRNDHAKNAAPVRAATAMDTRLTTLAAAAPLGLGAGVEETGVLDD